MLTDTLASISRESWQYIALCIMLPKLQWLIQITTAKREFGRVLTPYPNLAFATIVCSHG